MMQAILQQIRQQCSIPQDSLFLYEYQLSMLRALTEAEYLTKFQYQLAADRLRRQYGNPAEEEE